MSSRERYLMLNGISERYVRTRVPDVVDVREVRVYLPQTAMMGYWVEQQAGWCIVLDDGRKLDPLDAKRRYPRVVDVQPITVAIEGGDVCQVLVTTGSPASFRL